jgi:hypothetical protein
MASPDNIGPSAPVYLENVSYVRRNVQTLAASFLLLSAPQPNTTLINVPISSVTVGTVAPSLLTSNTPMPFTQAPVYTDQPSAYVRSNRWLDAFRWNYLNQPNLGPIFNVPVAAVTVTPTVPNVFEGFLWLYLPSDDGWWPEPDTYYKANAGYNFALLAASTTPAGVTINMPSVAVSVATFPPNVVAAGNGATINLPSPPNIGVTPYAPTVTQINSITFGVPVAQVSIGAFPPALSALTIPIVGVTLGAFPPTVINTGQPTIWDATYRCVNAGLTIGQDQWVTHPFIPYGYVISQSPASGTQVPPWTTVNFVVSFGPGASIQSLTVPSVVGLESYQAEQQCVAAGMDINPRAYAYSATVPADYVIAQSVAAGISVYAGTPISMTVSIGTSPTTTTVTVP